MMAAARGLEPGLVDAGPAGLDAGDAGTPGQVAGVQATLCVVPKLGGKNAASAGRARERIAASGASRQALGLKKGVVLSQSPKAGKRTRRGRGSTSSSAEAASLSWSGAPGLVSGAP